MKNLIIKILVFLNTKPIFRTIFFKIHEIRDSSFKYDGFVCADIGFLLGCYDFQRCNIWQKIVMGKFETEETCFVIGELENFDLFIDIGANIGYYTCLVGRHKPVMAFEPRVDNLMALYKNISVNNIKCSVYDMALGNGYGTLNIYGDGATASINKETFATDQIPTQIVSVGRLDDFSEDVTGNIFIKIDVEGSEYDVLLGAREFIKKHKPILLMEICEYWASGKNPNYEKTFRFLMKLGYEYKKVGDSFYFKHETL